MQDLDFLTDDQKELTQQVITGDFKPKVVPVHELHTHNTFFTEEQLQNDPEARELEDLVFAHGKAPSTNIDSSLLKTPMTIIDEFGNVTPSKHAMTTFNEFGVNEQGQTISQVLEQEQEARMDFDEYSERYLNLQTQIQKIKSDIKALDLEYKDRGCEVGQFKKAIKWVEKYNKQTQDERWIEGVMRQWALSSKPLQAALAKLDDAKEETKEIGRDKEARQRDVLDNMKTKYDRRYERDKQTNRGHLDNLIEQQAVFASFGVDRAEQEFIKLEESKKIRDARRAEGLPDLALHSNELQPANRAQFTEVFDAEFHKRREEFEAKKREEKLFDPEAKEREWQLDYEPTDVPVTFDFDELKKHGLNQAKKLQDSALLVRNYREGKGSLPGSNWVKKFENLTDEQLTDLIKLGARAEDYWDNKVVCDQLYLPNSDERREHWDSPSMRIARYNRLVRTGMIPGEVIEFNPKLDIAQAQTLPEGI